MWSFLNWTFESRRRDLGDRRRGVRRQGREIDMAFLNGVVNFFLDLGGMVERGGVAVDGGFPAQIV